MKLNFCTLFNSAYLSRGIVLYESLRKYCPDFHLYVFAFDEVACNFLRSKQYRNMTVVSLKEFEDAELLRVKPGRTAGEYCWTCTSSTILYSIRSFGLDHCTYIDADMQFFADPSLLIAEMGKDSVLITEHRYTPAYDQSAESGKYCVQFVTFRNDARGMKVLNWWRERCIEWCYAYAQDGKFGDQKYLDDWTSRFEGVHELKHLGGGIAPWNVQQYTFEKDGEKIIGTEISTGKRFPVVFFHFHGVRFFEGDIVSFSHSQYDLTRGVQELFYRPYVRALAVVSRPINTFNANGSAGKAPLKPISALTLLKFYIGDLRRSYRNLLGQNVKKHVDHHYFYYVSKL